MSATPLLERPVPRGPRAYRRRIRLFGPLLALGPAAVLGLLAMALLRNNQSTGRGGVGFVAALLASPCIVFAGLPLNSGSGLWAATTVGSIVLWLLIGMLAARRATQSPVATWRNFWREYAWPATGVWIGALAAFVIADVALGRALF